jgi:hypothetical protein
VATLIVILLVMAAVKHMVVSGYEDLAYARRGKVSPRRQAAMDRAKAKQSSPVRGSAPTCGICGTTPGRTPAPSGKPSVPAASRTLPAGHRWLTPDDYPAPDPWSYSTPAKPDNVQDIAPKTVPDPATTPKPEGRAPTGQAPPGPYVPPVPDPTPARRRPSPTPRPTGGTVAVEAENYDTAAVAQQRMIQQLTVVLNLAQEARSAIATATDAVESLDGHREPLGEDAKSLQDQLTAKRLDTASVAGVEQVVTALAPEEIKTVQESMGIGLAGIDAIIARVTEALEAAQRSLSAMTGTYAEGADLVATTGIDPTFLGAGTGGTPPPADHMMVRMHDDGWDPHPWN